MRTIQEIGIEFLNKDVKSFYIFGGCEYGIKMKYIEIIKSLYQNYIECESLIDLLSTLSTKSLLPRPKTLYIIRYDDEFVSKLDKKVVDKLKSSAIPGTIIMLYDNDKQINKLDKFLPEYTVIIDKVDSRFIEKYLKADFPELDDEYIKIASELCDDYYEGKLLCNSMSMIDKNELASLSKNEISDLLGKTNLVTTNMIKSCVGARSISTMCKILDVYQNYDDILYRMLSAFVELEKSLTGNRCEMDKYKNYWTIENVYNMYMHTFNLLCNLRRINIDPKYQIICLFSLMQYKNIPSYEVMKWN